MTVAAQRCEPPFPPPPVGMLARQLLPSPSPQRAAVAPSLELPSQKHLSSPGPGRGHLAVPHTASLPEAAFLDLEPCGHVA